jgi:Regulator of ribonuclease activity B
LRRNFRLSFSQWTDAARAATRLEQRGYEVAVSYGADERWQVVASKAIRSWQIVFVERRMKRLATRLHGKYEGI